MVSLGFERPITTVAIRAPSKQDFFTPLMITEAPDPRMGTEPSKTKCLAASSEHQAGNSAQLPPITPHPQAAETIIIPRIPQEIADNILNHLSTDSDISSLRTCALVSRSWALSCRPHLFHTVLFNYLNIPGWLDAFPVPEESPARHVRNLGIQITGYGHGGLNRFLKYIPRFAGMKELTLWGHGGFELHQIPSLWKLPQSVTSLTIVTDALAFAEVRDIMVRLPNLDDLSLSGSLPTEELSWSPSPSPDEGSSELEDRDALPRIGTVMRGRFGGRLVLRDGYAGEEVMNMLSEIQTGFRFREMQLHSPRLHLPSTVRLVEACNKTLVKLLYTAISFGKPHFFSQSSWL